MHGAEKHIDEVRSLNWHWQLGGDNLPFSIDHIKKALCDKYHLDPATATEDLPGISSVSAKLRQEFIDSAIVGDRGNHPFLLSVNVL